MPKLKNMIIVKTFNTNLIVMALAISGIMHIILRKIFIKRLQNVSRIHSDYTGMINVNPVVSQNYYIILKRIIILVPIY